MNGDGLSVGICGQCGWHCEAPGGDTWALLTEHQVTDCVPRPYIRRDSNGSPLTLALAR